MDKAIQLYMDSLKQEPFNADMLTNLAVAHIKLENWSQAEEFCTQCLYLYPANIKTLCRRTIAMKQLGCLEKAKKDWVQVSATATTSSLHFYFSTTPFKKARHNYSGYANRPSKSRNSDQTSRIC